MASEIFVNKITGTSGTSGGAPITLSGDTATLGSGATFSGTVGTGTTFHQNIQPAFSVYNSGSNQSIVSGSTWNKIQFNQADLDTVTGFNDSEDRYEFQVAGYYFIIAQIQYGGGIVTNNSIYGGIYFYDTSASSGSHYTSVTTAMPFSGGDNFNQCIHAVVNASVGDYVYAETQRGVSSSDSTVVMAGSDRNTIFSGFKILS
jgi:hypothetical protein